MYGASASGKETFIQNMVNSPTPAVLEQLGWSQKKIAACEESLKYIGQFYKDPITESRSQIMDRVPELLERADVILLKGQFVDFAANRLGALKKSLPLVKHRVILLQVDLDELNQRLIQKPWWKEDWDAAKFSADELDGIRAALDDKNLQITVIDANKSGGYKLIRSGW